MHTTNFVLIAIIALLVVAGNAKSSPSSPNPTPPSPTPRSTVSPVSLAPSVNSLPSALSEHSFEDDDESGVLQVGALLPVSGDLATLGKHVTEALDIAKDSFKHVFPKVSMIQVNTKSDPKEALKVAKKLYKEGVRLFIGPFSSSETERVMDWIEDDDDDGKEAIVISPYATATHLSKYKRLFRLSIDNLGLANYLLYQLASQLSELQVTVLPIIRDDVFATEFAKLMGDLSVEYDHVTFGETIKYQPGNLNSAADAKESMTKLAAAAKAVTGQATVLVIGFGETKYLLEAADAFPELTSIPWFSNGAALDESIISSEKSIEVATKVNFQSIEYRGNYVLQDVQFAEFMDKMYARTQTTTNPVVALTHDALLLAYDTSFHQHSTKPDVLLKNLKREAKYEYGVSGRLIMTEDNQRNGGEFLVAKVEPIPLLGQSWQITGIIVSDVANNHTVISSRFVGSLAIAKKSVESCASATVSISFRNAGFAFILKTLSKEQIMAAPIAVPVIGTIVVVTQCDDQIKTLFCPYAPTSQGVKCELGKVNPPAGSSKKRDVHLRIGNPLPNGNGPIALLPRNNGLGLGPPLSSSPSPPSTGLLFAGPAGGPGSITSTVTGSLFCQFTQSEQSCLRLKKAIEEHPWQRGLYNHKRCDEVLSKVDSGCTNA